MVTDLIPRTRKMFRSWRNKKQASASRYRRLYEEPLERKTLLSADGFSFLKTDFNCDGVTDLEDLNIIRQYVPEGGTANYLRIMDVNMDKEVNEEDVRWMMEYRLGTRPGDANGDGLFNADDLIQVMKAGQYEDGIKGNSTWKTGDWDGDKEFTSHDFVAALIAGPYDEVRLAARPMGVAARAPASVIHRIEEGDFNEDGVVDVKDIDLLSRWIGPERGEATYLPRFDLNHDGRVNNRDFVLLTEYHVGTTPGDANLDGRFTSSDLVIVMLWDQYEDDEERNSTWETGDWNGDAEFTSADLVVALTESQYEDGLYAASVDSVFS